MAKSTLSQFRNMDPTLSPINNLPCEILSRIFAHMCHLNTCLMQTREAREDDTDDGSSQDEEHAFWPEVISHVCSHWRRVALASQELWSHVDIAPSEGRRTSFMSRSQLFASRGPCLCYT
ncbi:hypothetical protein B0J17DRAFT_417349 [Rhizoctonia solani]|nr:hypothetical protein B0J17DRAFT_417349 [Rhizoctonia solani]